MTDRVQRPQDAPPPLPEAPSSLKHCWVTDRYARLPALLLEWRRTESGYQGRVLRPVHEDGNWIVVQEWLPAALLDPA